MTCKAALEQVQVSERNKKKREEWNLTEAFIFPFPRSNQKNKRVRSVYLLMKSHRAWDAEEHLGLFEEKRKLKRVPTTHHSSGQEE